MKKYRAIMSTTHVDLHGDKMSLEALNCLAKSVREKYLPVSINHDVRSPPVGRVASAEVVKLPDGEYGVQGTIEVFEPSDTIESLTGDGRKIPIHDKDIQRFFAHYDRSFSDAEGQGLIKRLGELSGQEPQYTIKKALEPVSVLIIAAGIFVFGSIGQGFFKKLGEDLYLKLKDTLARYYAKKTRPDQVLEFSFSAEKHEKVFEVKVLLDNPSEKTIGDFFTTGIKDIDHTLALLPEDMEKDIAIIVLEYRDKQISISHAVRNDSVPIALYFKTKKKQ